MFTSAREHSAGSRCSPVENSIVNSGHCLCVSVLRNDTSLTGSISLFHKQSSRLEASLVNYCQRLFFTGEGVFVLNGAVEDSATAEISRSQV